MERGSNFTRVRVEPTSSHGDGDRAQLCPCGPCPGEQIFVLGVDPYLGDHQIAAFQGSETRGQVEIGK